MKIPGSIPDPRVRGEDELRRSEFMHTISRECCPDDEDDSKGDSVAKTVSLPAAEFA